jgi:DNA-binding NtrC family response regulator
VRVLVVDDEADLLDEVVSYLRRRSVNVLTAGGYEAGLRMLSDEQAPIDVLVTDARLPDGNGIDLIPFYLERGGERRTSILMTGHLDQSQITPELRGVRIFAKPFALSQLYREIKAAAETPIAA